MDNEKMPAVVVVHGAWHPPIFYEDVISQLKSRGFTDSYCPRLPSATRTLPLPDTAALAHDTAVVRSLIDSSVSAGRQVIVLCHSYGGVVGNNSVEGLLWPQRQAQGLSGGVIHMAYMAAFVIPPGTALNTPFNGAMMP